MCDFLNQLGPKMQSLQGVMPQPMHGALDNLFSALRGSPLFSAISSHMPANR